MKEFIVKENGAPDIQFTGVRLAQVSTEHTRKAQESGRWTMIEVYKTNTQKYVVHIVGMTTRRGEVNLHHSYVYNNINQVVDKLGYTWLAKLVYEKMGIAPVQKV